MYKRASTGSCPSDSKEEQQDMGVPMHSPSEGESFPGGSQEKGEIVGGARRKVSPQASQANFGQGSRPLPPHIKWWLSVCSPRLRGRYQPEQEAIESEEPSAPSLVQEQQASSTPERNRSRGTRARLCFLFSSPPWGRSSPPR